MARSRTSSRRGEDPGTAWGCASGERSAARARGTIIGRFSARIFRGRKLKRSTNGARRLEGWTVSAVVFAFLGVYPSNQLAGQGVLNQFSYDELRLSGIQLDVGVLGASE